VLNNKQCNILFLCTGNSARSIMAEALLNHLGNGRFKAFSAGSKPKAHPHPKAVELLKNNNLGSPNFRSKSWDEFSETDAPEMYIVITVCSNAANESCPLFPGAPILLHWDLNDPAREFDSDAEQTLEFQIIYKELQQRIQKLIRVLDEQIHDDILNENLKTLSD